METTTNEPSSGNLFLIDGHYVLCLLAAKDGLELGCKTQDASLDRHDCQHEYNTAVKN
jgi:hypothetical protein